MIWQLAGIVGIDPGPFTLRELIWMTEGRRREEWSHTANVLALIANVHRNPKKRSRPFTPNDFFPFAERKRPVEAKVKLQALKDLFVRK